MDGSNIANIIFFTAIIFIAVGISHANQAQQPIKERIRYIPRSLEEEAREPVKVEQIFKSMFENQAPWIGNFNDKNVFKRRTLDKGRGTMNVKEKKPKISGNKVDDASSSENQLDEFQENTKNYKKEMKKMKDKINKLTNTVMQMTALNDKTIDDTTRINLLATSTINL